MALHILSWLIGGFVGLAVLFLAWMAWEANNGHWQ